MFYKIIIFKMSDKEIPESHLPGDAIFTPSERVADPCRQWLN
jgi:hypothetical protein